MSRSLARAASACIRSMLIVLSLVILCDANSNGGPSSTCANAGFIPSHGGATFSTTAHGYSYALSPATWSAGQTITVTLTGSGVTPNFNGHMIAVIDSTKKFQGTFAFTGSQTKYACTTTGTHVALTQPSNTPLTSLSFSWTAPATGGLGTLTLTSTVMQSYSVFWKVQVAIPEQASAPTGPTAPSAPTNFQVASATTPTTNNAFQNVTFTWSAPSQAGSPPFTQYRFQLDDGAGGALTTKLNTSTSVTTCMIPNLASGKTYKAQVLAYAAASNLLSPASTQVSLTIAQPGSAAPNPPAPTQSSVASNATAISFSWPSVGASGFIAYEIEARNSSDPVSAFHLVATTTSTTLSLTNVAPNSTIVFRLRTHTTSGYSSYSSDMIVQTSAMAVVTNSCPNSCSNHGTCSPASTCICAKGFVGLDCSVASLPGSPVCTAGSEFCLDWGISNNVLIARIVADIGSSTPELGYTSIGFGAPDGMTGANIITFQVPTAYTPAIYNYQCSGLVAPVEDDGTIFDSTNSAGYTYGTTIDVTFHRPLQTANAPDYVLKAGVTETIGWANDPVFFNQHAATSTGRGLCTINFFTGTGSCGDTKVSYSFLAPIICMILGAIFMAMAFQVNSISQSFIGTIFLRKRPSTVLYQLLGLCLKEYSSSANTASTGSAMLIFDELTLSFRTTLRDATFGDFALAALYTIGSIASIFVGYAQYSDNELKKHYIYAHLSALQFALVFLPITRNSIWTYLCGIPYERAIRFHRYAARMCIVVVTVHMVTMNQSRGVSVMTEHTKTVQGSGVVYGTASYLLMCIIVVASTERIRRILWEPFFLTHMLFIPCVITACFHDTRVLYYLIFPLVLYLADHAIRFYRSYVRPFYYSTNPEILSVAIISSEGNNQQNITHSSNKPRRPPPRIVRFELKVEQQHFEGGDYLFVNIPTISKWEWHPFSISNAPNDPRGKGVLTLHILDFGVGTWTGLLADQVTTWLTDQRVVMDEKGVQARENQVTSKLEWMLPLRFDGPYGKVSVPLNQYGCIVLTAGGVGITPMMSIMRSIIDSLPADPSASLLNTSYPHLLQIHLIWTCRSATSFETWFPELLSTVHPAYRHILHLHLYYTGLHSPASEKSIATTGQIEPSTKAPVQSNLFAAPMRPMRFSKVERGVPEPPVPHNIAIARTQAVPARRTILKPTTHYEPDGFIPHRKSVTQPFHRPPPPPIPGNRPAPMMRTGPPSVPPMPPTLPVVPESSSSRPLPPPPPAPPAAATIVASESRPLPPPPPPPPCPPPYPPMISSPSRDLEMQSVTQEGLYPNPSLIPSSEMVSDSSSSYGLGTESITPMIVENVDYDISYDAQGPSDPSTLQLINGRPCFPLIFDTIQSDYEALCAARPGGAAGAKPIVALSCGPPDLVNSVQKAAMERNWHLHKETFLF